MRHDNTYGAQLLQRGINNRVLRSGMASVWLLVLLNIFGCIHASQVTENKDVADLKSIRPVNLDSTIVEEIGREALQKIGYEEVIKLAEKAGFVAYKSDERVQLASYGPIIAAAFVPVFSRYAVAAAVTSQADSPLPGPADLAALGVVVIGLVDAGLLDGHLLTTVEDWLVDTRGKLMLSQAKVDDTGSWERPGKEGRGRGANRADGRMVDDAARHAGVADRAGFGKFIEAEKRAT